MSVHDPYCLADLSKRGRIRDAWIGCHCGWNESGAETISWFEHAAGTGLFNHWECGCTIHADREDPCTRGGRICLKCERECWGLVDPLRGKVEEILTQPSIYHDAGAIIAGLQSVWPMGRSPIERWKGIPVPITREDVDDLYGGVPPPGRNVIEPDGTVTRPALPPSDPTLMGHVSKPI